LLRFAHKTSKNRLKRRFFTLQTRQGGNCQAETAKKTKFSRGLFIVVFMAFFNEKTIKTYKRDKLPGCRWEDGVWKAPQGFWERG
jgi:hypothetical protein